MIENLKSSIESLTGNSARLKNEIATLRKEVAENTEALESATAMRQKELAEFSAEESDMVASIGSMKGAIVALSKHHEASFLQVSATVHDAATLKRVAFARQALVRHADLVSALV